MTTTPGYTELLQDAVDMLQSVEWSCDGPGPQYSCFFCGCAPKAGHLHDCRMKEFLARAAELTQVTAQNTDPNMVDAFNGRAPMPPPTAQSAERASPAKDGGEQSEWRDSIAAVIAEMRDAIEITPGYNAQSRLREWSTRLNVLWLNAQPLASQAVTAATVRPQSAVQGCEFIRELVSRNTKLDPDMQKVLREHWNELFDDAPQPPQGEGA